MSTILNPPVNEASPPSVWVLTDGKIGDDVQCLAIARALNPSFEKRVVCPDPIIAAMAPWGPVGSKDLPEKAGSPIAPPFPDIVVCSGRRAMPYARLVRKRSRQKTKIVVLKDPRMGRDLADVIWAPTHDKLDAANAFSTLTSPNELIEKMDRARCDLHPAVAELPRPMLGVILGGVSGSVKYDSQAIDDLTDKIERAAKGYKSVAITPSRRTPDELVAALKGGAYNAPFYCWDGSDKNPYPDILAVADTLIVTADSHNMMSEALATGTGVYAYRPPGLSKKLDWFLEQLIAQGYAKPLEGDIASFRYPPLDATTEIIAEIRKRI